MQSRTFNMRDLLKPHARALGLGLLAAAGVGAANLLEPWPLKIILDNVLRSRSSHGWLFRLVVDVAGQDRIAILKLAIAAVILIAAVDAVSSYAQKYLTTSVGQWVTHDLRRMLYSHIQRLSLAYHDSKQTGDLISRVTSDIGAIQSFITSGLLESLTNCISFLGLVAVFFSMN